MITRLVALAQDPATAAPWVGFQRELDHLDVAQSPAGDVRTIVAQLALDGLWLSNLIDPERFTPEQLDRVLETIWPGEPPARGVCRAYRSGRIAHGGSAMTVWLMLAGAIARRSPPPCQSARPTASPSSTSPC